ncbi:hypothetical protein [uncultured Shewanella sp.]|uniref:hypothetical protein n=1 Tax=uncultured Shewanella sp. TaxID=173975 RepID=UPI00260F7D63|nr:hypothetical protein [uncultured Shewanella sp.]
MRWLLVAVQPVTLGLFFAWLQFILRKEDDTLVDVLGNMATGYTLGYGVGAILGSDE